MIKNSSLNRIIKMSALLAALSLFYLFPNNNSRYNLNTISASSSNYHDIFLLDNNGYVSKTTISVRSIEKEKLSHDLLESLIINGKNKNKIPNNFKAILPEKTKVLKVSVNNDHIYVSFSKEIMKTKEKDKMIECIIYTLTSISNIKYVNLEIEGEYNDFFKKEYTRSIGINKEFNINSLNNIKSVNVYYVSSFNNVNYYVPVTKYYNSKEDKIRIIIDELSSKSSYESNLMSYLNYDTKLISYTIDKDDINLYFNDSILNKEDDKILEEVIYSISYSIKDTIEVSNVHFFINDKEF